MEDRRCTFCDLALWALVAYLLAIAIVFFVQSAGARDDGRWAQSPLKLWFESLKNHQGEMCCAEEDRIEVDEWHCTADDKCEVVIGGVRRPVPPQAILRQPNLAGVPLVWVWGGEIKCFLRGAEV